MDRSEWFPGARERAGAVHFAGEPVGGPRAREYFGSAMQAAVAGEFGHVQLVNPASAQLVVLIQSYRNIEGGNPVYRCGRAGVELTTLIGRGVDAIGLRVGSTAVLRSQTNASLLVSRGLAWLAAATTFGDNLNGNYLVLMPGDDATFADETANQLMGVSLRWREVPVSQWR